MGSEIVKEIIKSVVDSGAAWFLGAGASGTAFVLLLIHKVVN